MTEPTDTPIQSTPEETQEDATVFLIGDLMAAAKKHFTSEADQPPLFDTSTEGTMPDAEVAPKGRRTRKAAEAVE